MQINIAFGITSDWTFNSAITALSILKHSNPDDNYKFYILSNDASFQYHEIFNKLNQIRSIEYQFIEMNDSLFDGVVNDPNGVSPYYRLKLPSLLNEDKILYLDSDIIALSDVAELYSKDISSYYFAAVEDKFSSMMRCRVGLSEEQTFFNSGVLLLNLKRFREENLEEIIFEKLRDNVYTDQDVLNDVCRNAILSLPIKYNVVHIKYNPYKTRTEEYMDAVKSPVLFHFLGKPWAFKDVLFAEEWIAYKKLLQTL